MAGSTIADHHRSRGRPAPVIVQRNGYRCRLHCEARLVEIHEGSALLRSIACVDDGGPWTFEVAGQPLPVESTFDYSAKRDRFTSENLSTLLESLGARRLDGSTIPSATEFVTLTEEVTDAAWRRRIESAAWTARLTSWRPS